MNRSISPSQVQLVTPKEWAEMSRQTYRKVLDQIRSGDLPAINTTSAPGEQRARFLIDLADAKRWLESRKTRATVEPKPVRNVRRASRRYV